MVAEREDGRETNCRDVKGTGLGLDWMDVVHGGRGLGEPGKTPVLFMHPPG